MQTPVNYWTNHWPPPTLAWHYQDLLLARSEHQEQPFNATTKINGNINKFNWCHQFINRFLPTESTTSKPQKHIETRNFIGGKRKSIRQRSVCVFYETELQKKTLPSLYLDVNVFPSVRLLLLSANRFIKIQNFPN